ncbi:nitrate/nitrite transporter [Telluribacter sp. SYSU D00476]|uniref:MFS transporter n=1 Tax=Telluribacter sp. SYSU D00476 TaxID=2811430 RepID=UPI001FF3CD5D|nr:MFS transporter [Telluribacter sp. SYSU D00476]
MESSSLPQRPAYLLPLLVAAQFAGTSLWFAPNAVLLSLQPFHPGVTTFLPTMTTAVQLGFVLGTLCYSYFSIADRYSPVRVFMGSALLAALTNAAVLLSYQWLPGLFMTRMAVGFFLAGVYPVGMKICSDWYEAGLGKALGYLVGALVLGTAFPHLIRALSVQLDWRYVILATSALAVAGGLVVGLLVADGPFRRKAGRLNPAMLGEVFRVPDFRRYAFGYFGHMFEIYTFWAFVPLLLLTYTRLTGTTLDVSLWSFVIIAVGALGCVSLGELSVRWGSHRTAWLALVVSAVCCGLVLGMALLPVVALVGYLLVWGISAAGDSPQFSTLVAQHAPADYRATALTIVTSIGFFITIPSLYLTQWLFGQFGHQALVVLVLGGIFGLRAMRNRKVKNTT